MGSAIIVGPYRYRLDRPGLGDGATMIIMVNPSTADADEDDATIRKVRGFGRTHRWGRLMIGNLFAWRARDVRELARADDPIGPDNDRHLAAMMAEADRIIVAWGPIEKQPRAYRGWRWHRVVQLAGDRPLWCIGPPLAKGHPRHPLMPSYEEPIMRWRSDHA